MNHIIITAALATADSLEQRAAMIRAEVAAVTGKANATLSTAMQAAIEKMKSKPKTKPADKTRTQRNLSPEARKRIADAQKKRWEKFRKSK
jgi:hypothetical protein